MLPTRSQDWIALLQQLADRADVLALQYFGSPSLSIANKPDASPVTQADLEIEREVEALAGKLAPGLGVLGEEYGYRPGSGTAQLIVDPIDATLNFIRGDPVFATLLAVQVEGEVVAGLASAPAIPGRWWAARGCGAWRDGQPIRVSTSRELSDARLFCGTPSDRSVRAGYPGLGALLSATRSEREVGDFLQHLWVAEGRGEIAIDLDVAPWDIAALQVIVEEAGGTATAADGLRTLSGGTFVSTNGPMHRQVLAFLGRQAAPAAHGRGEFEAQETRAAPGFCPVTK
jgi:histidinol-phosphatase